MAIPKGMEGWVLVVAIIGAIWLIGWLSNLWSKAKEYDQLRPKLAEFNALQAHAKQLAEKEADFSAKQREWTEWYEKTVAYNQQLASSESDFRTRQREWERKVQSDIEAINTITQEKSQGFPWLAQAYADYFHLQDLSIAGYLTGKSHPAVRAADHLREVASKRRIAEQLYRVFKYKLQYYENLFPFLVDFTDEDIEDLIIQILDKKEDEDYSSEPADPAKKWLTAAEYVELPSVERNQRALDRYRQKKKSKWEIGRDYERYVGYLYETAGFVVRYQGIIEGFEDLGRDLVAVKGDSIEIVQCKHWSQAKTIHEKHVFQLFGTTIEYWLTNMQNKAAVQLSLFPELLRRDKITPGLFTSTRVSDKAKAFASVLGVKVVENFALEAYPCIKCNVSRRTGERIYHLPFDQQYDRTVIEDERNECYVWTVQEAEELGFRRAFRWRGESNE